MNIKEMSVTELKSMAYDFLVQIDVVQSNLRMVNQEIQSRLQTTPEIEEKKEEDKK